MAGWLGGWVSGAMMPAAAPDIFSQERERLQRALAKNIALVTAKRRADAYGLEFDYATGQAIPPPSQAPSAKKKKPASVYMHTPT